MADQSVPADPTPGIDSAIDAAARSLCVSLDVDYDQLDGHRQAGWRRDARAAVDGWLESRRRIAEESVPTAGPTRPRIDARCTPPSDCWMAWEWDVSRRCEAVAKLAREEIAKARAEQARLQRCRWALSWLVALKDGPCDETYEADKPRAWDEARAALAEMGGEAR